MSAVEKREYEGKSHDRNAVFAGEGISVDKIREHCFWGHGSLDFPLSAEDVLEASRDVKGWSDQWTKMTSDIIRPTRDYEDFSMKQCCDDFGFGKCFSQLTLDEASIDHAVPPSFFGPHFRNTFSRTLGYRLLRL